VDISKQGIKDWLARYPDRDRGWLADRCEVEKRTVDNWLSSPREIPSKALLIIEQLMRRDMESDPGKPEDEIRMPVSCTPAQFDLITRAFKSSECETLREWIVSRLDAAADAELCPNPAAEAENLPHAVSPPASAVPDAPAPRAMPE
jgi:hypothetical protein